MKLKKSKIGKVLIVLYYAAFGTGTIVLIMFIMPKAGILAGLAAGFTLGIICGIIGGELEFIEHRKIMRKKYTTEARQGRGSSEKQNKVITFRK